MGQVNAGSGDTCDPESLPVGAALGQDGGRTSILLQRKTFFTLWCHLLETFKLDPEKTQKVSFFFPPYLIASQDMTLTDIAMTLYTLYTRQGSLICCRMS